jgi:hypothetical protein
LTQPVTSLAIAQEPFTPEWWVARLAEKHRERLTRITKFLAYYEGDQDLSFATTRFKEHYGGLFKELAVNICGVIVQAMVERMKVQGISIPASEEQPRAYDEEA